VARQRRALDEAHKEMDGLKRQVNRLSTTSFF
jgi:hypothetical protein